MASDLFQKLSYLPDSGLGKDGHYSSVTDVYGTPTSEQHTPSLQAQKGKRKYLPFACSEECKHHDSMRRMPDVELAIDAYSKFKLSARSRHKRMHWRTTLTVVVPGFLKLI